MFLRLSLLGWLLFLTATLVAQRSVTGQLTEAGSGDPLVGATVRLVGTDSGVITDLDGRYRIEVPDSGVRLRFSYVGMLSQEEVVRNRSVIDVALRPDNTELQQVVVTGYRGTQRSRDLVGSYDAVAAEELATDRPIESIDQLLEGRIAGVQVQTVTGEPGLPIRVQIRGQSSLPTTGSRISASTQPLYVLDGVPLYDVLETNTTNTVFGSLNNQPLNPLSLINPDDIESVTVLKDASATALYGADAANGVVLITTKQGAEGPPQFALSLGYGTGRPINEIRYLNTEQYLELARETLFNSGENPELAGPSTITTDWRRLVQQNPQNGDVDLSVSGGRDGLRYRVTAGYSLIESVHKRNGIRQGNLNLNLTLPLGDRLRLATRISGSYQGKEGLRSFDVYSFLPNLPVRRPDGSFNNDGFFERRPNPVALLEQNENNQRTASNNAQLTLHYDPLPSLRFRLLGGLDQQTRNQRQYRSALNGSGAQFGGRLSLSDNRNLQWITNGQVTYSPALGDVHHLSALFGGELTAQDQFRQLSTGKNFPTDNIRRLDVLPTADTDINTSRFERRKASLYGELSYNYAYRYYLKVNLRNDASSLFGGDHQANTFWAVGASWNFAEEPWLAGRLPFGMDYGKLRLSQGLTGNSRVGVYTVGGVYDQQFFRENYGGQLPLIVDSPPNDLLGWERKRQSNLGLNLGWDEGRITFTAEAYNNLTVDGLYSFAVPTESGFDDILANVVRLRNWGYEFSLNYRKRDRGAWSYSTSLNFARNFNRLLSINRELPVGASSSQQAFLVGRDINLLYGIRATTVNPETGAARWLLPDGSVTEVADEAQDPRNYVPIGRANPLFFGGWHQHLGYGPLGLTLQINYSYGGTELVDRLTFTDGQQILINNQSVNQLDRWQQPGDVTDVPRLRLDAPPVFRSSRNAFAADYLHFATLGLDADLTALGVFPATFSGLRFFAVVTNLGYLYGGAKRPDRNGVAEYRFTFPQQRSLTLGLKFKW